MNFEHGTSNTGRGTGVVRPLTGRSRFEHLSWFRACLFFLACAALLAALWRGVPLVAQPTVVGTASNLTMSEYFDPPHEKQMKSLITGAEAQPQPEGSYLIKGLRLELFDESGKTQTIVEAPECVYDVVHRIAHSPGQLRVRSGDGRFRVEGEGFLWQQDASTLTISNKVHTTIRGMEQTAQQQ